VPDEGDEPAGSTGNAVTGRRAAVVVVAVLAGCDAKREPAAAEPKPAPKPAAIDARVAALPGVLWFVDDAARSLARLERGVRTEVTLSDGARLFPSRWSLPDGRLVAIASRGDGSANSEQVALVAGDGSVTRIGSAAAMVRDPAVARDGRWIVVAANPDGHMDLYRIEKLSSARITRDPKGSFTPTVLTADTIAFASSRDDNSEIYRATVDGEGTAQRLTAFHKDDFAPAASPDGTTIAFASDREGPVRIFVMAADGTGLRRLTTRASAAGDELDHTWSRDGKRIAYLVGGHVFVRDLAAATERDLTPAGARDAEPSFSPDGAWLAVSRDSAIVAIELATATALQVTTAGTPRLPRWQQR
jgi:TolB protein